MGFIPDVDSEYEGADIVEPGAGSGLAPGEYDVTVVKAVVGPSPKPWIDAQFSVQLQTTDGQTDFINIEVAPLTKKDGTLSKGKLGFLKGQLQKLGYSGPLSKLETPEVLNTFTGVQCKVTVKNDPQKNADGTLRLKPNSNEPWINHEVIAKEFIAAGLGGSVVPGQQPNGSHVQVNPIPVPVPQNTPVY